MEYEVLGWPSAGVTLDLDHETFRYAGQFVRTRTGKAVTRDAGTVIAAASFSVDRTDDRTMRIRTITVSEDWQGQGVGSRLLAGVRDQLLSRGYEQVIICVNNPFAYQAAYRAGFGFTDEDSGIAELVLRYPSSRDQRAYRAGLQDFIGRDELPDAIVAYARERLTAPPPPVVEPPPFVDSS